MASASDNLEKWTKAKDARSNYLRFGEIQKFNDGVSNVLSAK